MNRKAQTIEPIIVRFLVAFIAFAFVGMIFFSWANEGASKYGVSDYNQTTMSRLDISSDVNNTFQGLDALVNPTNASGSGTASPTQTDILLGTASSLGRFLFYIPRYIGNVLMVSVSEFGVDPRIAFFGILIVAALAIAIFIQIAIGRGY